MRRSMGMACGGSGRRCATTRLGRAAPARGVASSRRAAARPGFQDELCRAGRQAFLCAGLARPAAGRRDRPADAGRRHFPFSRERDTRKWPRRQRASWWRSAGSMASRPAPPWVRTARFCPPPRRRRRSMRLPLPPTDRKDDVKLSAALHKLLEEDPALGLTRDAETGDTLLAGQGEIHLNRAVERLAQGWGLTLTHLAATGAV